MPADVSTTDALCNPLANIEQLQISTSQLDGVSPELEASIRHASCRFMQAAGILLGLSQDIIAQGIILFTRFWIGPEGGSLKVHGAEDVATAALYLAAKVSADPQTPRRILLVTAFLHTHPRAFLFPSSPPANESLYDDLTSEEGYHTRRSRCMRAEAILLRTLAYQIHAATPYTLCINYLQTLDAFHEPDQGRAIAARAFAHLNTMLLSPQLIYATHQPTSLATAAIYLAAREIGLKLPEQAWWEVFDTSREELGFLVASITSTQAFAQQEESMWPGKVPPLDTQGISNASRASNGTP